MIGEIDKSLEKAAKFLVNRQMPNGGFKKDKALHNEPPVYMTDLVLSSEAMTSFILINKEDYLENTRKAIFFCSDYDLEENSSIEMWAWKLIALKNLNTPYHKEFKKLAEKMIRNKQKGGYWPHFPTTSNLTNFYGVFSLFNTDNEKNLKKAKAWFEKNMAKDKKGWGMDQDAKTSETTFTSNVIISMVLAGAGPRLSVLKTARKFIESTQRSTGAWASTKFTTDKETAYATALSTLSLMLLSENPFDKKIEKGIRYLLKTQRKNGGWPLIANEKESLIYTTFFSTLTLSFYKYLLKNWENESEMIKPPELTCFLFKNFVRSLNNNLVHMTFSKMLDSKMLGSTINAVQRRKDILNILLTKGAKDVASVIDELKKESRYSYLNKKHHITQIKSDMDYLKSIMLIDKIHDLYFICVNFFNI